MSLITSTISHEMRNPLNSIISQCKIQEQNIRDLKALIKKEGIKSKGIDNILERMEESNIIQITSSQLLQFHVEDILGLAQIKAGKFHKNVERINIERTVQEVVKIQEYNAQQKKHHFDIRDDKLRGSCELKCHSKTNNQEFNLELELARIS